MTNKTDASKQYRQTTSASKGTVFTTAKSDSLSNVLKNSTFVIDRSPKPPKKSSTSSNTE